MGTIVDKLQAVLDSKNAIKSKFNLSDDLPFNKYADSIKAGEDVTLGVVDAEGKFQPLTFDGTTASNDGEPENVVNYHSWDSTLEAPTWETDLSFITAESADILEGKISVDTEGNPITGTLKKGTDVSDTTATANDVKQGTQFYNAQGILTQGTFVPKDISITLGYVTADKKFQPIVFDGTVGTPSGAEEDINTVYRCDIPDIDDLTQPLTFVAQEAGSTIQLNTHEILIKPTTIQYRANEEEEWKSYNIGDTITLQNVGDQVQFQNLVDSLSVSAREYVAFSMTGKIAAYGNIQSMLNWSTTVTVYCYSHMFEDCTSLIKAPVLPVTTLEMDCYSSMFKGCTSLPKTPELPAMELAESCYSSMFAGCTSLTDAPALPAITLVTSCYSSMFAGCTSLPKTPELPATTLDKWCYSYMFRNCEALTEAPDLPATTLAEACYYGMFQGCTSLTKAPDLPATTLVTNCYSAMFRNCERLQSIKVHFKTWNDYTIDWLGNVAPAGIFYKPSELPSEYGYNGIPEGWEVVNID